MQSAKNRLEMAVSPQAKQTPPPGQPDIDTSTYQGELTQDQKHPAKCSPGQLAALGFCPQSKSRQGAGGLSAWNDPEEHSSLRANPTPKFQSHQGAVRRWSDRVGADNTAASGEGWRWAGWDEHPSPASQRSKHRARAHKNANKPGPPSLCSFLQSPWGLGFPTGWRGTPSPHPALTQSKSVPPRELTPCP